MKHTVRLLVVLFGMCLSAHSQQPVPPVSQAPTMPAVDPALHENVVKLVDLMGSRKRMVDSMDQTLEESKRNFAKVLPNAAPEFADEWVKRMRARTDVDDYVNVIVAVYEKHFNTAEIAELIQIQRDANESKTPIISPSLKEKLGRENIAIMSEVVGGCSQVGAKLGGQIAEEIGREHPEWVKETKPSDSGPKNR